MIEMQIKKLSNLNINWNSKINIIDFQTWMNGGSLTLLCEDENEEKFKIDFVQNVFFERDKNLKLPGRIYLNDTLIQQRSENEYDIIHNLENLDLNSLKKLEKKILRDKIMYMKSNQYLLDVGKVILYERK
ncbi:hypothetical protein [Tenacibaculum sediminilitoris]|uniref:hypothetical protein n=1 Tax=Tenacibaculum sediminilitoris TaxID=1820334 RepID=UPI0038B61400